MAVYLPPKLNAKKLSDALTQINETIGKAKDNLEDPLFFIGGDFNKFELSRAFEDYPDILELDSPPQDLVSGST